MNAFEKNKDVKVGDHIAVKRALGGYTHHGIYIGDNAVIHFSGEIKNASEATIRKDSLEDFLCQSPLEVVDYPESLCFPPSVVVDRAKKMLGSKGVNNNVYVLFSNNCEHFSVWAKTGIPRSVQIQALDEGINMGIEETSKAIEKYSPNALRFGIQAGVRFGQKSMGAFGRGAKGALIGLGIGVVGGILVGIGTTLFHYLDSKSKPSPEPSIDKRVKHHKNKINSIIQLLNSEATTPNNISTDVWTELLISDLYHIDKQILTKKNLNTTLLSEGYNNLQSDLSKRDNEDYVDSIKIYDELFRKEAKL